MQKLSKILLLLSIAVLLISFVQTKKEKVDWITMGELQVAYTKNPKPILIDVYTGWCGWCKVMDKDTYNNEKVANYINENFYAVKFNAESTDSVMLGPKKYGYNAAYNANDLAVYLLFGQMGFPTTVFLTSLDAQPASLSGFLKPSEIEPPLKYFGEGAYKKQDFTAFMKGFSGSW